MVIHYNFAEPLSQVCENVFIQINIQQRLALLLGATEGLKPLSSLFQKCSEGCSMEFGDYYLVRQKVFVPVLS
jgi:hypothetical protein